MFDRRGSSPKLILWNNALINGLSLKNFNESQQDRIWWGRLVENAAGAHLLNGLAGKNVSLTYWRKGAAEVDFVLCSGTQITALEIKSGRVGHIPGLAQFKKHYPKAKIIIISQSGTPLEEFFTLDPLTLIQ